MTRLPASDVEDALAAAAAAFENLRGARILFTGGTGFFGRWMLETLVRADERLGLGIRVVVVSRHPGGFTAPEPQLGGGRVVTILPGDVRTFELGNQRFSHVVHAATSSNPGAGRPPESPLETVSTIVDGTRHVLAQARAVGATRLLFVSSGAVYGRQPPDVVHIDEDYAGAPDCMDPRPVAAYGHAKRMAEQICVQEHVTGGPAPVIARPFALVGPHLPLDAHFAIGNFIRDGLRNHPIRVVGDGTPRRSYLYASDLTAWLWTLLASGVARRTYNVGSEVAVSIADLAGVVARRFGVPVEILGTPVAGRLAEWYVPSTRRAREELGLAQTVDLTTAIDRTARWYETASGREEKHEHVPVDGADRREEGGRGPTRLHRR